MKNILRPFTRRRILLLFGLYLFTSFLLMSLNSAKTLRGLRIGVLQVVGWVYQIEQKFQHLANRREENKKLKKEVFDLSFSNQRLQEMMLENIRLRRLLKFKNSDTYKYVMANVIGYGQEQTVRSIVLDAGVSDSISKNMPVLTDNGLVGKIFAVESNHSIAQVLMDRNSLVSSRLQKSRELGVISWNGNLWLDLNYIPKEINVDPGEVVVTSGLSRFYPKGIKIGIVGEIEESEYELYKKIKIKPSVDFNSLEEVFILLKSDSVDTEITGIE